MKNFMDENFLLETETARKLFFEYAKDMPIFDYHCHLSPKAIFENQKFKDITEIWLGGDHYKWRAMRGMGLNERFMTGDASSFEKFSMWAKTLSNCIGNPLYHWTHLELQRFFDIYEPLSEKTAKQIFDKANEKIQADGFSARDLIVKSNVKIICTTDDPIDSLEYHEKIAADTTFDVKILPAFRPDKALNIHLASFSDYINQLATAAGVTIDSFEDLLKALDLRIEFFAEHGCRASDHAFEYVPYEEASCEEVNSIFQKAIKGEGIASCEKDKYQTALMQHLGARYAEKGWGMEIHIGAIRDNNRKMFEKLGSDIGFDSVTDNGYAKSLSRLLDSMNCKDALPRTILFTLNPKDNYVLGTMLGNFQSSEVAGKIQFGTAWWFVDNRDGMQEQMRVLSNLGVLGKFIGMLTDSRSFLSYPRHEYFRRILCNLIGNWVENGEYPNDIEFLGEMIKGISYNNAVEYFGVK